MITIAQFSFCAPHLAEELFRRVNGNGANDLAAFVE